MRGSLVVLAVVALPFVASAQGHSPKRTDVPVSAKCTVPGRGNSSNVASQTGTDNRVDPTTRGNKDCVPPVAASTGHSSVTGTLYNDPDGIGSFAGQYPLVGWTVQLSSPAGIQTAISDGNGMYSFSNLNAGSYTLCVVPPGGWVNTGPASGASCPGPSFGYTIDAPAVSFDVIFSDYNFGFKSAL